MYRKLGNKDRAPSLCSAVLRQELGLDSAPYNYGDINLLAGHHKDAESMLSRVSAADPAQANPCFFLERVYMRTDHIWLKAHRGELNEDPVTFAIRDRLSCAVGGAAALAIAASILGIGF